MISAPTIMKVRCSTVAARSVRPNNAGTKRISTGRPQISAGAEERADQAAKPADDHHEQNQERLVDVEALGFGGAEPEERHHRAGDAAIERRHREGEQLGLIELDADQLGGDVHVAHRHPHAADAAAHQIGGEQVISTTIDSTTR